MKVELDTGLFDPGNIYVTPAVLRKIDRDYALAALRQHLKGEWGLVDRHDWKANDRAVRNGGRIVSVYPLPEEENNFWIITEDDRSATTFLLPSEY